VRLELAYRKKKTQSLLIMTEFFYYLFMCPIMFHTQIECDGGNEYRGGFFCEVDKFHVSLSIISLKLV